MPSRSEVYSAIDTERVYQKARASAVGIDQQARPHSVEEYVLYMDDYMRELKTQLSRTWTPDRKAPPEALDTLRKVVALGVACMEHHGAPERGQSTRDNPWDTWGKPQKASTGASTGAPRSQM